MLVQQGEEEKERGSQLHRHVANCRVARWKETVHGGGSISAKGEVDQQEERSGGEDDVHRGDTKERCETRRDGRQRRPVICDSKRAIHLTTCQDSIGGICLWNQSRRTLAVAPRLLHVPPRTILRLSPRDKTRRTEGREWKAPDLSYRRRSVEGDYSNSWLVETDNTDKFRYLQSRQFCTTYYVLNI